MIATKQHPPVILLLGERTRGGDPVGQWLAESRYSAIEAADVFHALEQISDFTLRDRPDVIFLHADSIEGDLAFMQTLIMTSSEEPDIPIIDFARESKAQDTDEFEKVIAGLACRLDEFIPQHRSVEA